MKNKLILNQNIKIITHLINSINLKNINFTLIKKNAKYLYNLLIKIKKIWIDKNQNRNYTIIDKKSKKFNEIITIVSESYLSKYDIINQELLKIHNIIKFKYENIVFYYLNQTTDIFDIKLINYMFNQTITLAKYYNIKNNIIIIWLPIDINRDFIFDSINKDNLTHSTLNYNAFTASGVTFGTEPRYTIITRYEEVSKLLLHELIHNFNIDGHPQNLQNSHQSHYIDKINKIIKTYSTIKNNKYNSETNYDYEFSIYESYTELLSSYLNIIFLTIDLETSDLIILELEKKITIELLYSYNTIANLIHINNYKSYDEFYKKEVFVGNICIFEYYYLKGLMYNNYELNYYDNADMLKIYSNIISMNRYDKLLKEITQKFIKQQNYKYLFYS